MRDVAETAPELVLARTKARRNQATLNVELGITNKQGFNSGASSGGSSVGGSQIITGTVSGGGGGGYCFTHDMPVLMANGSQMHISTARIGSYVLAPDPHTGILGKKRIISKFVHEAYEYLKVTFADGRITGTTERHKYRSGKGYVPIMDLEKALHLDGESWKNCNITGKEIIKLKKPILLYNLEIVDFNSYVLNGDWVSNRKATDDDEEFL